MKELNNTYAALETGKTYRFAGYDWTACEVDKERHVAVIQSHGITHGEWPGFKMEKFGNGDYYSNSIAGKDISTYNDKMQSLYAVIKDAEDKSASYGKGLYLVPKEKVGSIAWGEPGSGNYWQALKETATDRSSFGSPSSYAWLGTVFILCGNSYAWCVYSTGSVYNDYNQDSDFVVAPAFNLDLSKVEIDGDEIVIKANDNTNQHGNQSDPSPYRSIWEYGMDFTQDGKTVHVTPEMVSKIFEAIKEDNGRNYVATYTDRKFTREQYIDICDEVETLLADDSGDAEYRACEHVLGVGFDKE